MKTRPGLRWLVLLVIVFAVVIFFSSRNPEPIYHGKRLSYWLTAYSPSPLIHGESTMAEANSALDELGTNALPTLLNMLAARDTAFSRMLRAINRQERFVRIPIITALDRHISAINALERMGPDIKKTISVEEWLKVYNRHASGLSQTYSGAAIGELGAAAKPAIPALLNVATNLKANAAVRVNALNALSKIQEPSLLIPILIAASHDPSPMVRDAGVDRLGIFGADAKAGFNALLNLADDTNSLKRKLITSFFDPPEVAPVPKPSTNQVK